MSGPEPYLPSEHSEALQRLRGETASPILAYGPVLEIAFPAASTRRDVQHGMGVVPTGFLSFCPQGGNVQCFDVASWTTELAFLIAITANTRVRGCFILTEVPIDA